MNTYYFNNKHNIDTIKEDIDYLVENNNNNSVDMFGEDASRNYSEETIDLMRKTSEYLSDSFKLVTELDNLFSGVVDEQTYAERTKNILNSHQTHK